MSKKSLIDISIYALVFANLFFLSAVVFSQIILKGETVSVPDLAGRTLPEAKALGPAGPLLRDAGLFKGRITQIHTPRAAAGKILAQHPQAGEPAERNSAVGLLASQGDREDRYVMPDLIGLNADTAVARL